MQSLQSKGESLMKCSSPITETKPNDQGTSMPEKPFRPCNHMHCPELVRDSRYCDNHAKEHEGDNRNRIRFAKARLHQDPTEAANNRFYSLARWQNLRNYFIKRHPLCARCGAMGQQVDHIVPLSQGGAKLSIDNLQTLCISCHARKSFNERR